MGPAEAGRPFSVTPGPQAQAAHLSGFAPATLELTFLSFSLLLTLSKFIKLSAPCQNRCGFVGQDQGGERLESWGLKTTEQGEKIKEIWRTGKKAKESCELQQEQVEGRSPLEFLEEVQQKQVETLEGIFHSRGTLRMCGENSLLWGSPDCTYWGHLKQGIQESSPQPASCIQEPHLLCSKRKLSFLVSLDCRRCPKLERALGRDQSSRLSYLGTILGILSGNFWSGFVPTAYEMACELLLAGPSLAPG